LVTGRRGASKIGACPGGAPVPRLLGQSEYNARLKNLAGLREAALRWLAGRMCSAAELLRLMDSTAVHYGACSITDLAASPVNDLGEPMIHFSCGYGGAVDGARAQVLLVDLGGVLFSFDHEHRLNVLGDCLGLPPGRVDELLWQSGFSASCDAGRYRGAAAVRAQIRRITGYAGLDERLDTAWCSAFRPDPDVIGLLARHPGGRRGVFTNNGPLEEEVLTRRYPDAFGLFEHLFFCWRLISNKPDPAVYRQVTDLLAVSPGQIGFADDSADNVEAALACGWRAVRYRSPGDLGALAG
jgi:putative hydrolase of the HAD superfamily